MLDRQQLMRIALNECVEMIGEDLVMKHKDLCCCTCGNNLDGMFTYNLGMDTKRTNVKMGDETPMEFYAFVVINPNTGEVTRDYANSVLPQ